MRHEWTMSDAGDIIDSRDVIARLDDLDSQREALADAITEAEDDTATAAAEAALAEWDGGDDGAERLALQAFVDEGTREWRHGDSLIRDSHFEQYARELAEDLHGAELRAASWPFDCIDWERAAEELQQDYSAAELDGTTYDFRS